MKLNIHDILQAVNGRLVAGSGDRLIHDLTIDSRTSTEAALFVPLMGTRHDGHEYIEDAFRHGAGASLIQKGNTLLEKIKTSCGQKALIEVDDPLQSLGDIAHCWRKRFHPMIAAITGSNGKTTTKEMIWEILRRKLPLIKNQGNYNNLIGLPLSLLQLDEKHKAAIIEMGMSERGEIKRLSEITEPGIGLITNIGPCHLDHLTGLDEVAAAKGELFDALGPHDTIIMNNDDLRVRALAENTHARILSYGTGSGDVHASNVRPDGCAGTEFDIHVMDRKTTVTLKLPGTHFVSNALAAASIAYTFDISVEDIKTGLEAFQGVPGRMETIHMSGMTIINDAYNANPVSMEASLQALSAMTQSKRKIAVLGDMLELGKESKKFHQQVGELASQLKIDRLLLIGAFSSQTRDGAVSAGMDKNRVILFDNIPALGKHLKENMSVGDSILMKGSRKMALDKLIEYLKHDESR